MKNKTKSTLFLFLATIIWGTSLVAQSVGMDYIGPFAFNSIRFLIGSVFLLPVILSSLFNKKKHNSLNINKPSKKLMKDGFLCGSILFITSSLQQIGILYTTVGKAGFITALYIIIVPILGLILFDKHITTQISLCIAISIIGMYLLCINVNSCLNFGDLLMFLCAISTAVHIILIGRFSEQVDCIKLSFLQFFICSLFSFFLSLIFEKTALSSIFSAIIPILYSGILSCGVAYTLQTLGQKHVSPIITSLIFSLESVFSALSGWLLLHEVLSPKEILGCIFIFAATIVAEIPNKELNLKQKIILIYDKFQNHYS